MSGNELSLKRAFKRAGVIIAAGLLLLVAAIVAEGIWYQAMCPYSCEDLCKGVPEPEQPSYCLAPLCDCSGFLDQPANAGGR